MIDARQLRYFVAVVEDLHFARAADRLNVAQSALSAQIQRLEQEIGVRLLNRNKRQPVTLTDAGRLFHAEAVAALRHFERADQVGRLAARGLAGVVRIGSVTSGVTSGVLSRMLRQFRITHGDVRIEVVAMETPRQFEALAGGEIDVGILRPWRQHPAGIVATIVQTECLLVAMAEDHSLAMSAHVSVSDLKDQHFIAPHFDDDDGGFSEVLTALGVAGGFVPFLEHRVHDFIAAISLASAGYGVVVVPESMRNFTQPGICYRPIADFEYPCHLAMASRKRELSPAVRAFVKESLASFTLSQA
jgi:LysR family transcriptional regulator, benzoate and cis,cis-muconate-responsive activator of ben and cat genes